MLKNQKMNIIITCILLFFLMVINPSLTINNEDRKNRNYVVEGANSCGYFIRAKEHAKKVDPNCEIKGYLWSEWSGRLKELQDMFGKQDHRTSPVVYSVNHISGMKEWIGGCDDFISKVPSEDSSELYL